MRESRVHVFVLASALFAFAHATGHAHDLQGIAAERNSVDPETWAKIEEIRTLRRFLARASNNTQDAELEAVVQRELTWPDSQVLVCFLDGGPQARDHVAEVAQLWTESASLQLDFGPSGDRRSCDPTNLANVRVSFRGTGRWSLIGIEARQVTGPMRPTMNLHALDKTVFTTDDDGVILHQFGHAIGFAHEHHSPVSVCEKEFDRDYLYKALGGSKQNAEIAIRQLGASSKMLTTTFDPASIMLYNLDKEAFKDPATAKCYIAAPNNAISALDREAVAIVYPIRVSAAPGPRRIIGGPAGRDAAVATAVERLRAIAGLSPSTPSPSAADPCLKRDVCTSVSIFFGTDREQQDLPTRSDFGPGRADKLQLGHAIVTVPRAVRRLGEIPLPNWLDKWRGYPDGDPRKHFTIPANGVTVYPSASEFLAAVKRHMAEAGDFKDHALVFIHGYRVTFDGALFRAAQITYDLGTDGNPFGAAFLYSWPSGGGLFDYKYDFDSARLAVEHLKSFLQIVVNQTGAKKVDIIAHSMGNWPLMTALNGIKLEASKAEINQVVLAAPDIDANEFLKMAAKVLGRWKGATLYASSNDFAMKAAREAHRGLARAGDVPAGGPVIVEGIDSIDISVLNSDAISIGHADYAERRELLNDVGLLLRTGVRPPHHRTPIYRRLPSGKPTYWKYPE